MADELNKLLSSSDLSMLTPDERTVIDAGREVLSPKQSDVVESFQYALTKHLVVYIPGRKASVRDPSHLDSLLQSQTEIVQAFSNELAAFNGIIQQAAFRGNCLRVSNAIVKALAAGQIPVVTTASFQTGSVEFATDILRKMYPDPSAAPFRSNRRERTVLVYGPPGVGKSSTLAIANRRYDLSVEDAGHFFALRRANRGEEQVHYEVRPFAALLLPPLEHYFKRMEGRNEAFPQKRGQHEMRSYAKWNGRQDWFDLVLSDPNLTPDRLVELLVAKLDETSGP